MPTADDVARWQQQYMLIIHVHVLCISSVSAFSHYIVITFSHTITG